MTISETPGSSENPKPAEWEEDFEKLIAKRGDETLAQTERPNTYGVWKGKGKKPLIEGTIFGPPGPFKKRVVEVFARKGLDLPVPSALLKLMEAKALEDATEEATEVPGWETTPGRKTEQVVWSDEEKEMVSTKKTAVPVGLKLVQLVEDVGTERIIGADVLVTMMKGNKIVEKEVTMPSEAASGREAVKIWADKAVALAPEFARPAAKWLSVAMVQLGAPKRKTLSHATWIGDRLHLPDSCERNKDISESKAREIWREICETILEHQLASAAITIGASVNSPQLGNEGLQGSTVDLDGDSSTGKTTAARIALAIWEEPPEVGAESNWSTTSSALTKRFEVRSPLPYLMDDTGTVSEKMKDPEQFLADIVMAVAQGRQRDRLTSSSDFQESGEWRLNAISTGETPILGGARVGGSARAIELTGPFMPDAKTADRLRDLAQKAHGWPGYWLTKGDWPTPELPELTAKGDVARRLAKVVAGHAAGFIELGRVLDLDVSKFAVNAAQLAVDEAEARLLERGATSDERFWNALSADVSSNPGLWPKMGEKSLSRENDETNAMPSNRSLHGVRSGGYIYAFKDTVKTITTEIQVSQTDVLSKLKKDKRLFVKTETRGNVERFRVNGAQVDCYCFDDPEVPAPSKDESVIRGQVKFSTSDLT